MTAYAVIPPTPPSLAIEGAEERFPVRRIYAIGRNYAAHAAETGLVAAPGISLKPADSIVDGGGDVPYPPATAELDPEVELVVAIGTGGADIARTAALAHVFGYAVGLDLIRRDVLRACIASQHSWDLCKSFAGASPCSAIRPAARIGHPARGAITLAVDGEPRQAGDLAEMVWDVAEIVVRLSRYDRLAPGDLIFTGTPKGPRAVARGNRIAARIADVGELHVRIV